MKANKELPDKKNQDSTTVEKHKVGSIIYLSLFPLLSAITVAIAGYIKKMEAIEILKLGILFFLLSTALMFYLRYQIFLLEIKYSKLVILVSYLIPVLLFMLVKNPVTYCFWVIGGVIASMLIDYRIGCMVYFNHAVLLSIAMPLKLETTIYFIIICALYVILSGALKNKSTVVYAAIILLSSNITLLFIINNFILDRDYGFDYLASFLSMLTVIAAAFLLSFLYGKYIINDVNVIGPETDKADAQAMEAEASAVESADMGSLNDNNKAQVKISEKSSYDILLSEDNKLLAELKKHSEALYRHAMHIGDLSGRAAGFIGANEALAKAGGYYHEIGKIRGKNYIEEGLCIADEYAFPEELKLILKQHNIKYDKPTFIESAIVMLSDNIASTIDYLRKTGNNEFTTGSIIDNIFKMRMDKGAFDESGLTVRDFKLLKEFYNNEYNNMPSGN
ncbi:MAG: HDIG domain-containing protein [Clostridiales bacterium]|nr:HDIG domain-containing protein [Clostridiales bacterium]